MPRVVKSHDVMIDGDYSEWMRDIRCRYCSAQVGAVVKADYEQPLLCWQLGRDLVLRKVEERWGFVVVERVIVDLKCEFPDARASARRTSGA